MNLYKLFFIITIFFLSLSCISASENNLNDVDNDIYEDNINSNLNNLDENIYEYTNKTNHFEKKEYKFINNSISNNTFERKSEENYKINLNNKEKKLYKI